MSVRIGLLVASSLLLLLGAKKAFSAKDDGPRKFPTADQASAAVPLSKAEKKKLKSEIKQILLDKYNGARFVVNAKVIGVDYRFLDASDGKKSPVTFVTFDVVEFLRGTYGNSQMTLTFTQGPTSADSTIFQVMSGLPFFSVGDEVILFLSSNGDVPNPVLEEGVLFVVSNIIFTPESSPLIGDDKEEFALGKTVRKAEILNRNLHHKGLAISRELSEFDGDDAPTFVKVTKSKIVDFLTRRGAPSKETFVSSRLDVIDTKELNSSAVAPTNTEK